MSERFWTPGEDEEYVEVFIGDDVIEAEFMNAELTAEEIAEHYRRTIGDYSVLLFFFLFGLAYPLIATG